MLEALIIAAALLGVLGLSAAWWLAVLANRGALGGIGSVQALSSLVLPTWAGWTLAGFLALTIIALVRHTALVRSRTLLGAIALGLFTVLAALVSPLGHHASIYACAFAIALLAALLAPKVSMRAPSDRVLFVVLWLAVTAVHATFSMHRFYEYGAGSWDMGCMIHNVYRASRFLDSTSTVLGEVDYLGDHFMIGIYMFAPIYWIDSSGYTLLAIQSVSLASTAPAIFLIARHHGAPKPAAAVLGLAAGLAFGMQSASYFDIHEITLGFGFLAWTLWAIETKRLRAASLFIALFALFKESLGAYVVGLGLLLLWRAVRSRDRRTAIFGASWIAAGGIWFVLVNRVFMPALIKRANPPEPHETFADFGHTIFEALIGIVTHPLKALGAIFVPSEKLHSLLVTFGGLGWLALFGAEILLPALPLFAERFLSSKQTMWEMGYHYGAPLTLYSAWAVAIAYPRIERFWGRVVLDGSRALAFSAYIISTTVIVNAVGYRHSSNYLRWDEPYFSTPARHATNSKAIRLLKSLDKDAKLAVQNRSLPHLANRPYIYRLGDWQKADYVMMTNGESAWPWDDNYPQRLARELKANAEWKLIFSEGDTSVFARTSTLAPHRGGS